MPDSSLSLLNVFVGEGRNIFNSIVKTVDKFGMKPLIENGVLLGLSGGADSVLLLAFLLEYRRYFNLDFSICAVHINHCIRGDEAKRDEDFCISLCKENNVELFVRTEDIPAIASEQGIGTEEAARKARYSIFREIIQGREDLSTVAVAHNMSDNAETVIFNILRGSGTRGASGISPVRENIIRPLIELSKEDIVLLLNNTCVPFVVDSTNNSTDYTRNYIRHEIVPKMKVLSESAEKMISRFSENVSYDDQYISSVAKDFLNSCKKITNTDLKSLHFAVYVRVLSLLVGNKQGNISSVVAKNIYDNLDKNNFSYSVGGGLTLVCERGIITIRSAAREQQKYHFLISKGKNEITDFKSELIISENKIKKTYSNVYKMSIQADLSSVIIDGDLYLRPKLDGDSVFYGGMTHKLKKMFNDRKIPPSMRDRLPILCDSKGVVWVPGFGVREDVKKDEERTPLFAFLGLFSDDPEDEGRFIIGSEFRS